MAAMLPRPLRMWRRGFATSLHSLWRRLSLSRRRSGLCSTRITRAMRPRRGFSKATSPRSRRSSCSCCAASTHRLLRSRRAITFTSSALGSRWRSSFSPRKRMRGRSFRRFRQCSHRLPSGGGHPSRSGS
eukprot:Amastigsp_a2841_27.p4 type:complete len:130 gc:universal Amastigsp_a2841_27:1275-886(-)